MLAKPSDLYPDVNKLVRYRSYRFEPSSKRYLRRTIFFRARGSQVTVHRADHDLTSARPAQPHTTDHVRSLRYADLIRFAVNRRVGQFDGFWRAGHPEGLSTFPRDCEIIPATLTETKTPPLSPRASRRQHCCDAGPAEINAERVAAAPPTLWKRLLLAVVTQGHYWIHSRRTPGRQTAGEQYCNRHDYGSAYITDRVRRADIK